METNHGELPEAPSSKPAWEIESRRIGEMSFATYRYIGERERIQIEDNIPLRFVEEAGTAGVFNADLDKAVGEFIVSHDDCTIGTSVSSVKEDGTLRPPQVWISGWRDATESEVEDFYDFEL